jgi:hypothetical protein
MIPPPVRNALAIFSLLMDLIPPLSITSPTTPERKYQTAQRKYQLYHGIFLDYTRPSRQTIEEPLSFLSPTELILSHALIEHTSGRESNLNHEGNTLPSTFLIHFISAVSDPQATSLGLSFLRHLLVHMKGCLLSHPTEEEIALINLSTECQWNDLKYKHMKSNSGLFAYDVFCGIFEGIGKLLKASKKYETNRKPLRALNSNTMGQVDEKRSINIEENTIIIWEPVLIEMVQLIQVSVQASTKIYLTQGMYNSCSSPSRTLVRTLLG